jgi:hypothetical protein
MTTVSQLFINTPWWVYALFAYLIFRGVKGLKPGETTLLKVAVIPVALTIWGLAELVRLYGLAGDAIGIWTAGLAIGAGLGYLILRNAAMVIDARTGAIQRPADYTLLPLVIAIFVVKYTFGAIGAIAPDLLMQPGIRIADLGLSGLFTGIFVGKFAVYAIRSLNAQATEKTS